MVSLVPSFRTWLTPSALKYVDSFKLEKDQLGRLCVRGIAKLILASFSEKPPSYYTIKKRESGAVFSPQSQLHLSFSHTDSHAAVAVSPKICGIDIENMNRTIDREKISNRFYSTEEHQKVIQDPHSFFQIWTAKEAFLKHEGTGINRPLKDVRVSFEHVEYEQKTFPLYTDTKTDRDHKIILSIVGSERCERLPFSELLELATRY